MPETETITNTNDESIQEYLNKLKNKFVEKDLIDFWVMSDRTDFKPIKNAKKKDIVKFLKSKSQYYGGKHIANVNMIFKFSDISSVPDDKWIFFINITIYLISADGSIDTSIADSWDLNISYNKKELAKNHFTIEELSNMIRYASSRKIISDIGGITYVDWIRQLHKVLKKERNSSKRSVSKRTGPNNTKTGSKKSGSKRTGSKKTGSKRTGSKEIINAVSKGKNLGRKRKD